ncbi:DUF3596 domain-containing protein [Citrobacter murliniae]
MDVHLFDCVSLCPVNAANIKKAGNLRALIISEIQLGQFDYALRFPESKAIKKFTTTRVTHTWGETGGNVA